MAVEKKKKTIYKLLLIIHFGKQNITGGSGCTGADLIKLPCSVGALLREKVKKSVVSLMLKL